MTGTLTHLYEADLDGTGTLVDITGYVASAGHWWGRRDWSAPAPTPGSLDLVLDNTDGRFTPGNTSKYAVGCIDGVAVKWTVTGDAVSRVRWFKMGTPELQFPNGGVHSSQVRVSCYDVLGELQQRTLRTMLDETVLKLKPYGYWRIDDSGEGLSPRPQDLSGNAVAQLVPSGTVDAFGWATGQGPAADAGGALHMYGDATEAPTGTAKLATDRTFSGGPQWGEAGDIRFAVGVWCTIRDIYKSSDDSVLLCTVTLASGDDLSAVWDPADGKVNLRWATLDHPTRAISVSRTHLVVVSVRIVGSTVYTSTSIDGGQAARVSETFTAADWSTPERITLVSGIDHASPHAGTVARVAIWPADALEADTGSFYRLKDVGQLWTVGQLGAPEGPLDRATRIAGYAGVEVSGEGSDRGDLLGVQDLMGKSALDAICDALRSEDAAVIGGDDSGPVLQPWLYSVQRPASSSMTVNVEDDCHGVPELSFDTSAVANIVTVGSDSVVVRWQAPDPGRWGGRSKVATSAHARPEDALAFAQYRALQGRISKVQPSMLPVDAIVSKADLRDKLLGLRPGQRILVSGLDADLIGYTALWMYVVGCQETHDDTTALFELFLSPADLLDPVWSLFEGDEAVTAGRLQASPDNVLAADITDSVTSFDYAGRANSPIAAGAAGNKYAIRIDDEDMILSSVSGATLTVTRGANSTTAAAHTAGAQITIPGVGLLKY